MRTSDLRVMRDVRSKTITLEITYTYGNSNELRPWTAEGTPVIPFFMYRTMYRSRPRHQHMQPTEYSSCCPMVGFRSFCRLVGWPTSWLLDLSG